MHSVSHTFDPRTTSTNCIPYVSVGATSLSHVTVSHMHCRSHTVTVSHMHCHRHCDCLSYAQSFSHVTVSHTHSVSPTAPVVRHDSFMCATRLSLICRVTDTLHPAPHVTVSHAHIGAARTVPLTCALEESWHKCALDALRPSCHTYE